MDKIEGERTLRLKTEHESRGLLDEPTKRIDVAINEPPYSPPVTPWRIPTK